MFFTFVINWLYRFMLLPVPIVSSYDSFGLVTIFDLFMFTVFLSIFFLLVKFIINDSFDFKFYNTKKTDDSYSSEKPFVYKNIGNSMGDRILTRRMHREVNKK